MRELPPDLQRLQVLETYLRLQLDAVRAAIATTERAQRDAEQQAETVERRRRMLAGWTVEHAWQARIIHHGECLRRDDGKCQAVTYAQARAAVDGGDARACGSCAAEQRLDAPA